MDGSDMSVRSSISARHMETWAHAQELYDSLGVKRVNHDRIKNIVVIGNNTLSGVILFTIESCLMKRLI